MSEWIKGLTAKRKKSRWQLLCTLANQNEVGDKDEEEGGPSSKLDQYHASISLHVSE